MTVRRALLLAAAVQVARVARRDGWRLVTHDLVAHPLLTLVPPLGEPVHAFATARPPRGWIDWSGPLDADSSAGHTEPRPGRPEEDHR